MARLVLSRKTGEQLTILTPQGPVVVTVAGIDYDQRKARLGFEAPRSILVDREEVRRERKRTQKEGKV